MKIDLLRQCFQGTGIFLLLGLVACSATVSNQMSPEAASTLANDVPDYSSKRIKSRETVHLDEGVKVHADSMHEEAGGVLVFEGRVFLDGRDNRTVGTPDFGWPVYAYASCARWNPATKKLVLSGMPVAEYPRLLVRAGEDGYDLVIDGSGLKTQGRTRVTMRELN